MDPIIRLEHLKKQYEGHRAVDDISFTIPAGAIFGLLGPNGAGKTTLLRMITGIFYPDEGQLFFEEQPFDPKQHAARIGYMPEERGLYKKMKTAEHVLYLARLRGLSESEARERCRFWMSRFELDSWRNKPVGDLSKGMQQKVQFIVTILHEPSLLILDEPFSGLDPINTNLIKEEIFRLSAKGTTIIFSTHRMEQVEEICNHIVLVHRGRKVLDGAVQQIKQDFKRSEFSVLLDAPPAGLVQATDSFTVERTAGAEVTVKLKDGHSTNEMLSYFIQQGYGVQAFHEILPTINDVFIRQVRTPEEVRGKR
ncbi:ATP-binding cassette domain-containing protein [Compostibacter hankyongensis]|uniref:ABC transporter ATP-binding protein n=1 Tax=Compostibacter hankyongensis TaxID=1007089 RepID=A0ABP8G9U6_9BACT